MGRVHLVGDRAQNPHEVSLINHRSLRATQRDYVPLNLGSGAMLRLAAEASRAGYRVLSLRLEDASAADIKELGALKEDVLTAIREGDAVDAMDLLLDWPADLYVSGLELRDPQLKVRFSVNRNGSIDVPGKGLEQPLMERLRSMIATKTGIFAT